MEPRYRESQPQSHGERGRVHAGRGGGGEEDDRALQIGRRAPPPGGDAREDVAAANGIVAQRLGVVGGHVAGRDRVHVGPVRCELVRERAREAEDPALRRGAGDHADPALERTASTGCR